jgi:hypothetical protein
VLWFHTGSADVLGVKGKLGSLEPGKFAVMIDPARLGVVLEDPYANLVLVTGERDALSRFILSFSVLCWSGARNRPVRQTWISCSPEFGSKGTSHSVLTASWRKVFGLH